MANNQFGKLESAERRTFLKYTAVTGVGGSLLPASASAESQQESDPVTRSEDGAIVLGDFESGVQGWKTDGGNSVVQVSEEDYPAGVATGNHALGVEVNGDLYPSIRKDAGIEDIDLTEYPIIRAHVIGIAEETDSELCFQFRLHHKPVQRKGGNKGRKKGKKGKKGNKSKSPVSAGPARGKRQRVATSDLRQVSQVRAREIAWDTSELSEAVRGAVHRIEIVWYLEDHRPAGGPRGRTKGDFEYEGVVLFDNIRLLASDPDSEQSRQVEKSRPSIASTG